MTICVVPTFVYTASLFGQVVYTKYSYHVKAKLEPCIYFGYLQAVKKGGHFGFALLLCNCTLYLSFAQKCFIMIKS